MAEAYVCSSRDNLLSSYSSPARLQFGGFATALPVAFAVSRGFGIPSLPPETVGATSLCYLVIFSHSTAASAPLPHPCVSGDMALRRESWTLECSGSRVARFNEVVHPSEQTGTSRQTERECPVVQAGVSKVTKFNGENIPDRPGKELRAQFALYWGL